MKPLRIVIAGSAIIAAAAIIVTVAIHYRSTATLPPVKKALRFRALPTTPGSYLGVYAAQVPHSYAGVTAFMRATEARPEVVMYYSGWLEPFRASFATTAANAGAAPLVQIEPAGVSLAAIAAGKYDDYLGKYADDVRSYGYPVILGFGHEMNGSWYPWANGHTSPATFVAAWRHIVTVFHRRGAGNVTWLWTVNVIDTRRQRIPAPGPWWPGSAYVTWVGIDGYYYKPSWSFAPLFGPTIKAVRALTRDPILIAETGATPFAGKPAKITDLFAGVRAYGLLGFVWYDAVGVRDWRIDSPAAVAAFREGAKTYKRPAS